MQSRLHLNNRNKNKFIEFLDNPEGLKSIESFRSCYPEFKYQRIQRIIQALPSTIPLGMIIDMNEYSKKMIGLSGKI